MGKVTTPIKVTNWTDVILQNAGARADAPRELEIEALVDTGATELFLRREVVEALGLTHVSSRPIRTANGVRTVRKFGPVRLEIQGRDSRMDVLELDDSCANLVGQVPLEVLDFIVDPGAQRLIANPAHGGEWMSEAY